MKPLGALPALPVLKVAGVMAVAVAFAGAIAFGASRDNGPRDFAQQSTIPTPVPTRVVERPPTFAPPVVTPRAVIPGADKGGLFADGRVDLPKVDTSSWKTYSNAKYGYSFKYPPDWELEEHDTGGRTDPQGRPFWPLQGARVTNPRSKWGANIDGVNCSGFSCFMSTRPGVLNLGVSIEDGFSCSLPGKLVADDIVALGGLSIRRCVTLDLLDGPRVELGFAYSKTLNNRPLSLNVLLERGRATSPAEQSVLETILSTLVISP